METLMQPLIGTTLHTLLPGRLAFQRPLETGGGGGCMLVDERKVAATQDMWTANGRYTMLQAYYYAMHMRMQQRGY
jgi:hypothetical protein